MTRSFDSRAWPVLALLATVSLLAGCDEECSRGDTKCLSDALLRVCVEGEDGNEWVVTQCDGNEVCLRADELPGTEGPHAGDGNADAGMSIPDGGAAASGGDEDTAEVSADSCVGACNLGQSECVTDQLARFCIAGGIWQLDMCDVGEQCVAGQCLLSDDEGAVQRCVPGNRACASETVEKVCDPDGTAWISQPCAANEVCMDSECVPDLASSCDDGNVCLDNKTAIRCLGEDRGFEVVECEGDTYCEFGRCRGDTCAIGSTCNGTANGLAQIRECTDGDNVRDVTCAIGEVCKQTKDTAECVPAECAVGTTVCGDPQDEEVDATLFFTTCVIGANSGIPEWVQGECVEPATCDPAFVGGANPCRQTCSPGAQRCAPAGTATGVNDGFQECDEDGEWGPVQRCNPSTDTQRICNIEPNPDPAALPVAVCASPVCNFAVDNPGVGVEGACEGTRIRRCNPDGTLSEPEDCEAGICRELADLPQADGRSPGACDDGPQCQEGEERCVDDGGSSTPRYQTCQDGLWSTALQTCADDALCLDFVDDEGLSHKLCGAACVPDTRRCDPDSDGIQICDEEGSWGDAAECDTGVCTNVGSGDAVCTVPCTPDAKRCTGSIVTSSDGVHTGTTAEQTCANDGTWQDAVACEGAETCRKTGSGVVLGCVECLGSDAPGGNTEGLADTRCGSDTSTQACGADNTWEDAVACTGSRTCVGPQPPECGECLGPDGTTTVSTCTLANYGAVPYACGSCTGPDGSTNVTTCTEANYLAVPHSCGDCPNPADAGGAGSECTIANIEATIGAGTTCADVSAGSFNSSWAGVAGCCEFAQLTYGDADAAAATTSCNGADWAGTTACCAAAQITYADQFPTLSCSESAWGGEVACCAAGQVGGTGPSFAYCAEP